MRRYLVWIAVGGMFFAALAFGIAKRQTYTDLTKQEDYLDRLMVAELPESIAVSTCEDMMKGLPDAPVILRVEVTGEIEQLFMASRQKAIVREIYAGDGIEKDEEVYLFSDCWGMSLDGGFNSIERRFVNILDVGTEYLVFAGEVAEIPETDLKSVKLYDEDFLISSIFCYEERQNTILPTSGDTTYVPYKDVRENEFFVTTEKALQSVEELKSEMLRLYPADSPVYRTWQKESVLDFREQKKEMVSYEETDSLGERIRVDFIDLPRPEDSFVSAWTIWDDTVYFGMEYEERQGEMGPLLEHYAKVMSYDMGSGETNTLYQSDCVTAINDICTDGEKLIWEESPWGSSGTGNEDMSWYVRMLSLKEEDSEAEIIFKDGDTEGELWDAILTLTEEKVYWYDQEDVTDNEHPINLFSYVFKEKKIAVEREELDLSSPYEHVSVKDEQICTYAMYPKGDSKYVKTGSIHIQDLVGSEKTTIFVPTEIKNPISNQKLCIWGEKYDAVSDELWVYDYNSEQLECISLQEIDGMFSYELLDGLIIMSTYSGLWCLEPETQTYTNLLMYGEEDFLGFIRYNLDGTLCVQIGGNEEKIRLARISLM